MGGEHRRDVSVARLFRNERHASFDVCEPNSFRTKENMFDGKELFEKVIEIQSAISQTIGSSFRRQTYERVSVQAHLTRRMSISTESELASDSLFFLAHEILGVH